jgi:DCN1-like protein 4/5
MRRGICTANNLGFPILVRHRISSLHALALAIRDLESLLLLDKAPLNRLPSNPSLGKKGAGKVKEKEKEPYNRDQYWDYAADKKAVFLKLYGFCFALAKQP